MNWVLLFCVLLVLGLILILCSAKKQAGDKDQPMGTQIGYLALVLGLFGLLAQFMSFTAVMLVFVLLTGIVTALNRWVFARKRDENAIEPSWIEYGRSFFPIILAVFVLRSFIVEPFQIPSSSMRPGLIVGDFILVNKFSYGLRLPVLNSVMVPIGQVERGDVVVFNYPRDTKVDFIKRVIGLPGDIISYRDKLLTVNGQAVPEVPDGTYSYIDDTPNNPAIINTRQYRETLGKKQFDIIKVDGIPTLYLLQVDDFPGRKNCEYDASGFTCTVPPGKYFMMGDNRDGSADSRYWGFVDDRLLVGKAFMIWMNFGALNRIGQTIH